MQPRVPLTPHHAQLSVAPSGLSARDDYPASRAKCEKTPAGLIFLRPVSPVSLGEGAQPRLSVQEETSLQMKSQTLYVANAGEDFSFHCCSAAWLLNELAALCFGGP